MGSTRNPFYKRFFSSNPVRIIMSEEPILRICEKFPTTHFIHVLSRSPCSIHTVVGDVWQRSCVILSNYAAVTRQINSDQFRKYKFSCLISLWYANSFHQVIIFLLKSQQGTILKSVKNSTWIKKNKKTRKYVGCKLNVIQVITTKVCTYLNSTSIKACLKFYDCINFF